MKTYDEMFRCVLARRDAYQEQRMQCTIAVKRAVPVFAAFVFAVVLGSGVWNRQANQPDMTAPPVTPTETETETASAPTAEATETKAALHETQTADETHETAEPAAAPPQDATEPQPGAIPPAVTETNAPNPQPTAPTPAETAAPTAAQTEPPTAEVPVLADEQLTGFRVEQYQGYRKIICTDPLPAPKGELSAYTVEGGTVELLATADAPSAEPVRSYEIRHPETGAVYTVTQREYAEFVLTVSEGELIDISLNRAHGFFVLQEETCSLYWLIGGEGFFTSGSASDLRYLLEIARSFTPAES